MNNIRQFKLGSGEELICQVLEWGDKESADIVARHVYEVQFIDDNQRGYRIYNLKPWMTMQEGDEKFITINTMHIMSQAKPDQNLIEQFERAIENSKLTEEEIAEKVEKYLKQVKVKIEEQENVVKFPSVNRDKLH